jgi:hypothetical protein
MSFAHDSMSVSGGFTRHLMSSSAALPLSTTLLLTDGSLALPTLLPIGSLPLPTRPQNGVM